jgi:hypothetical protein
MYKLFRGSRFFGVDKAVNPVDPTPPNSTYITGGGGSVTTKYHACLFHSLYLNAR